MARRIVSNTSVTPTATADTTNLPAGLYPFLLRGGSTTQVTNLWEISISGQAASSSSPTFMLLSYDSQISTGSLTFTGTGTGTDAPQNPATAALAAPLVNGNTAATTQPQRSATFHTLNASLNAFGGVYFWRANRTEECIQMLGSTTTNASELSLSAFTGGTTGAIGAHAIYETL